MKQSQYWSRFGRKRLARRRLLQTTAVGAAGLAVAAACGGGGGDEAPSDGVPPSAGEPKAGGTFRFPMVGLSSGNPPTLDANTQLTYLAQYPAAYHYSRLLKFVPDTTTNLDFTQVEGDASDGLPEIVDDVTFIFTLRGNLDFHDISPVDGRPVTAQDIVTSFERFAAESSNRGNWLRAVEGMEATDDKTLVITLRRAFAPAFAVLFANSDGGPWIVPQEVVDQELLETQPIGSGPFIFESWEPDVVIRWRKNPNWYDAPKPYIDAVEASLVNDPEVIIQNMVAGNLEATGWSSALFERVGDVPNATVLTGPERVFGAAYFNFAVPPFNDKRVRQALSMAWDRPGVQQALDKAGAAGPLTHITQFGPFYLDPFGSDFGPNAKYYERDVEEAKRLLTEAGYPNGIDLVGRSSSVYGSVFGDRTEAFGSSAEEAGFRISFDFGEYGGYISTTFFGDIPENELGIAPLMGSPHDPHNIFFTIFHPTSARHNWGPRGTDPAELPDNSPAGDQTLLNLWDAQAAELDFEARVEIVKEIQRNMAESMYLIPWTGYSGVMIHQPWVKNFQWARDYAPAVENLPHLWIDREA